MDAGRTRAYIRRMGDLETRAGLPPHLKVLLEALPRTDWQGHPNFDGLTRFWLDRHLMFRDVLARLRQDSEQYLDGAAAPDRHARETGRYAGFLLRELQGHHHIEDHHYFPRLRGLDGRIEPGFDLLDADHAALDGHIRALAETTNGFLRGVGKAGERDAGGRLHEALARFDGFLDRHLTDEEDLVVPVILTYAARL